MSRSRRGFLAACTLTSVNGCQTGPPDVRTGGQRLACVSIVNENDVVHRIRGRIEYNGEVIYSFDRHLAATEPGPSSDRFTIKQPGKWPDEPGQFTVPTRVDPSADTETVNLEDHTDAEASTDRYRLRGTIEPPHGREWVAFSASGETTSVFRAGRF